MPGRYYSEPMKDPEGYLTEEQFNVLVSHAKNIRDKILLYFLFYTGRRVSEVVKSVKVEDCDFRNNTILFTILKKRTLLQKRFNVDKDLMQMLQEYIKEYNLFNGDYLFNINRFRVDQIIKEIGINAEMEYIGKHKIHAHIFRHSFAVMKARKVKDMFELGRLQDELQHSTIEQTSFYFKHFNPREREFTDVMKDTSKSE